MKKFQNPEIEVVNFAVEDIITVSGGNDCAENTWACGNEVCAVDF